MDSTGWRLCYAQAREPNTEAPGLERGYGSWLASNPWETLVNGVAMVGVKGSASSVGKGEHGVLTQVFITKASSRRKEC